MGQHPLPSYHFVVDWGGQRSSFSEVSGLGIETEIIDYREGGSKQLGNTRLPGLRKFTNLVLKRGIVANDNDLFQWMNSHTSGNVERRNLTIKLLNESHEPVVTWKVNNAWPCKFTIGDLKAAANEVAIESIELVYEGLTMETS